MERKELILIINYVDLKETIKKSRKRGIIIAK